MIETAWDSFRCPIGVGHDVVELFPIKLGGLKECKGSHYVGLGECEWVFDASVNVAFCCKVDDTVDLLVLYKLIEGFKIADVHLYELVVWLVLDVLQVCKITGIGQLIQVNDVILGILVYKQSNYMRANESSSSGDYYVSFHDILLEISPLTSFGRNDSGMCSVEMTS